MPRRLLSATSIAIVGAGLVVATVVPLAAQQEGSADPVERGEYLLRAAGCVTCHTQDDDEAVPLAGGRELETRFGTFRSPNITPDPDTGIGAWTEDDFVQALKHGVSPAGDPYYPSFPYTSYTGMADADVRALFAYLQSIDPVSREVAPHDLDFPYSIRSALWPWRWLFFEARTFREDPAKDGRRNRGAYLVRHLGHCGECHTPRNFLGARTGRTLSGNPDGPEGGSVPNITPHPEQGIGDWSRDDLVFFLETGFDPDGDVPGGGMGAVIRESTSELTSSDREAIADYLMSLEPVPAEPE